jgi:O-antigen ligase
MKDSSRIALLQSSYKMIKNNYIVFGNGMLTFSIAKFEYSFPKWADRDKILSTHNLYLEHFVGLGLFGVLGITFLLFGTLFSLVRLKVPDNEKPLKLGFVFALLSCMLHGLVDCQVGNIAFSLPLFTILASSAFLICENKIVIRNHGKAISATDLR